VNASDDGTQALGACEVAMPTRRAMNNADEAGRRVFDGAWAHIPGAHRLLANVEFAQPNDYSVTTDPITGRTDGILKRQPRRAERRQGADEDDDEREGRPVHSAAEYESRRRGHGRSAEIDRGAVRRP
jgi:hypothetical protein